MKDIGRMMAVVFIFMSIYYLILFFRIGKCISGIERIEKKLDSIRPEKWVISETKETSK